MAVRPSFRAAMLAFVLPAFLPATASAQAPSAAPAPNAPAPSAPATGAPSAPAIAPTAAPTNPHPQSYGYSDAKPAKGTTTKHRGVSHAQGPVATLPGFEMLPDGGSRFFVEMTQNVPIEEKKAAGTITYVLKGEHVTKMNNENALVTVHFNTPVSRARLIPVGHNLHFILELRANVTPTFKVAPAKDGTAILQIEFPKGNFLPSGDADATSLGAGGPAPTDPAADPGAEAPAPPARPSTKKAARRKH